MVLNGARDGVAASQSSQLRLGLRPSAANRRTVESKRCIAQRRTTGCRDAESGARKPRAQDGLNHGAECTGITRGDADFTRESGDAGSRRAWRRRRRQVAAACDGGDDGGAQRAVCGVVVVGGEQRVWRQSEGGTCVANRPRRAGCNRQPCAVTRSKRGPRLPISRAAMDRPVD